VSPIGFGTAGTQRTRIVFIAELGVLSAAEIDAIMQACVGSGAT
jgi:hypothetical protein